MMLLKKHFGRRVAGLQPSVLGQCIKNKSLPRFRSVGRQRFVEILNVGDHWVCVSNIFGDSITDVFIYDSLYDFVHESTVVQVSSLLREDCSSDEVTFHLRSFQQQKSGTRTCGFYAAAAALSCCLKCDPTGHLYDDTLLASHFQNCMLTDTFKQFPRIGCNKRKEILRQASKRHCICHNPSSGEMLLCSSPHCFNWYHAKCLEITEETIRKMRKVPWFGPCCSETQNSEAIYIK